MKLNYPCSMSYRGCVSRNAVAANTQISVLDLIEVVIVMWLEARHRSLEALDKLYRWGSFNGVHAVREDVVKVFCQSCVLQRNCGARLASAGARWHGNRRVYGNSVVLWRP